MNKFLLLKNIDVKTVVTVALIGAIAVYLSKRAVVATVETITDELSFDNPEGAGNKAAEGIYDATHSPDGAVKFWAAPMWFLDKAAGLPTNGIDFSF